MKHSKFDSEMKSLEKYSKIKIPDAKYIILRADGRCFSHVTKRLKLKKPFDQDFAEKMIRTSAFMLSDLGGIYAYTQSDEISILLLDRTSIFNRRLEKLASIGSAIASSHMSLYLKEAVQFDCRVCVVDSKEKVIDYFIWRQEDSKRNAVHTLAFWSLVDMGETMHSAESQLHNLSTEKKIEFLLKMEVYIDDIPTWQKNGIGLLWSEFDKVGYNPITCKEVVVKRRDIVARGISSFAGIDWDEKSENKSSEIRIFDQYLPERRAYRNLIGSILEQYENKEGEG